MLTATLPDADEMLRRLRGVSDDLYLERGLYQRLTPNAGKEYDGRMLAAWVFLASHEYESGLSVIAKASFRIMLSFLLKALVDDEEIRTQTIEELRKLRGETSW